MLRTIRGENGEPYISLSDLITDVKSSKEELEEQLVEGLDDDDTFSMESLEYRIEFLEKLHESFKNIQNEYYKKFLGLE